MMAKGAPMPGGDRPQGEGERREAAMRRTRYAVIGTLFAAGLVTGFYVGKTEAEALLADGAGWSPALAIGLTGLFLAAMVGGSVALNRVMDELERERAYKASAAAGAALLFVYPPWFFLWKGGLLPEPMHLVLFGLFWASLAAAHLWYRYR